MNKKKILSLALVVCVAAILAIGGTLAYFTDSDEAKNTFTVGHVDIDLEETWEHEDDPIMPGNVWVKEPVITVEDGSEDCWVFAEIEMSRYIPYIQLLNQKYGKETVDANFANAASDAEAKAAVQGYVDEFIGGIEHGEWEVMNLAEIAEVFTSGKYGKDGEAWPAYLKVILGYKAVQSAGDDITVFEEIMMPDWVTSEMLGNTTLAEGDVNLNIYAKAIQASELKTLNEAYSALYSVA